MSQQINKIRTARFSIVWTERPSEILTIDLLPIIRSHELIPPYCLLHWQAKPKGLRRWGVYDGASDRYVGVNWDNLAIAGIPRAIEIDENQHGTVPTAVLLFDGCQLTDRSPWRIETPNMTEIV